MKFRTPETSGPAISWPRIFATIGGAILLTLTVEPALAALLPVAPAITLAVVGVLAANHGALAGVGSGIAAGLILDLLGGGALGVHLGSYALCGYAIGRGGRLIPDWPTPVRLVALAPLLGLQVPAAVVLARVAGTTVPVGGEAFLFFLLAQVVTVLVIMPFVAAVQPGPHRA